MANLFENPRTIVIDGPLRAGKSTLAALLAEKIGARLIAEPQENPFLQSFYRGDRNAAFQAQMWFLTSRFEQLSAPAQEDQRSGRATVADYLFEKDKIFASLTLNDEELALYNRQFHYFRAQLPTPDLVIYLQASPRTLRERIGRKGWQPERELSDAYIEQVVRAYEHFFFRYTASDLLVVNTDDIDFVRNNRDLQDLLRRLTEPVTGTQYFLPLDRRENTGLRNLFKFRRNRFVEGLPRALSA